VISFLFPRDPKVSTQKLQPRKRIWVEIGQHQSLTAQRPIHCLNSRFPEMSFPVVDEIGASPIITVCFFVQGSQTIAIEVAQPDLEMNTQDTRSTFDGFDNNAEWGSNAFEPSDLTNVDFDYDAR
jgi:hypothetical protein